MDKLEHTISELERWIYFMGDEALNVFVDALELLKEQHSISVDMFIQWCVDSQIMGEATRNGLKYWVDKFKEWNSKGR